MGDSMTQIDASEDLEGTDFGLLPAQGQELVGFHEILHRIRSTRPVCPVRQGGQPAWVITRYDHVQEVFRNEVDFPSAVAYRAAVEEVMGTTLQCMEGEQHRVNRALVSPAFRANVVPRYVEPILRPLAHRLVDELLAAGEADLVRDYTHRYPFVVIAELLGLPRDAETDETFSRWALGLLNSSWDPQGARQVSAEFTAFLAPLLEQRRRQPGDDLVSMLVHAEVEGERLTDEEIYSFLRLLFPAGADTTYLGLGNLLYALLLHPDAMAGVRAVPDDRRWAMEEALRWESPVALLPRICTADTQLGGETIPAMTPILLGISPANRDPEVFADPDRFDLDRRPQGHLTFGFGVHFCLGAHLARTEIAVSLDVLLDRLPNLRLTDEPRIIGAILRGPQSLPVTFDT